jgi:S-adenosylmethionine-dependent methyltransferase
MIDNVSDIASFYNSDPGKEHTRLQTHQLEHDLTWRYLNQFLPPRGRILEIGAATGTYTVELAQRGYALTAVDLSAALLEVCQERLVEKGVDKNVRLVVADARNLSEVSGEPFDAAMLMGPLYHLVEKRDRMLALKEAYERLHADGIIFSSFISRLGILGDLLKEIPDWIEDHVKVKSFLQIGKRPAGYPRGGFRGYFARAREIAPLHEAIGFETLVVAGLEPAISADDESYNKLQGKQRQLWLDLFQEVSLERSIIGASRHLLYIGKKSDR